jgi:hypothetical protein
VFSIRRENKTTELAVKNTEFSSAEIIRITKSQVKKMLMYFFNHKRIVQYEFMAQGQTVNQQFYLEVLKSLRESFRRRRPGLWPDKWILRHETFALLDVLRIPD